MVRFQWMNCGAMTLISTLITCRGPGSCIPFCTGCPKGAPDPCFHNISISITSIHFVAKVNFSKYTVVVSLYYITWLANVCDFASLRDNLFSCYPWEFASFRGKSIPSDKISVCKIKTNPFCCFCLFTPSRLSGLGIFIDIIFVL